VTKILPVTEANPATVKGQLSFWRAVVGEIGTALGVRGALLWFVPWLYVLPFRRRTIMRAGKPYLTRIYLTPSAGKLGRWWRARFRGRYLHCFHQSDPDGYHNHPWRDARSRILRGAYLETRIRGTYTKGGPLRAEDVGKCDSTMRIYWPGDVNALTEYDWHHVDLISDEVWTYFTTGPRHGRGWGFDDGRKGTSDNA